MKKLPPAKLIDELVGLSRIVQLELALLAEKMVLPPLVARLSVKVPTPTRVRLPPAPPPRVFVIGPLSRSPLAAVVPPVRVRVAPKLIPRLMVCTLLELLARLPARVIPSPPSVSAGAA